MASSEDTQPEFFKVFIQPQDSSQKLMIPHAFQDHIVGKLPNRVILRNHSGQLWPVEVVQIGKGLYFQGGWPRFVSDNSLKLGEFLVFKYNGHHIFDVMILGINGCQRTVGDADGDDDNENEVVDVSDDEEEDEEGKETEEEMNSRQFKKVSGPTSWSARRIHTMNSIPKGRPVYEVPKKFWWKKLVMSIPQVVIKKYGLKFGHNVVLKDPAGRDWFARVRKWKTGQLWLSDGLSLLYNGNYVSEDDTLILEFMPSSKGKTCETIKIHIIKSST